MRRASSLPPGRNNRYSADSSTSAQDSREFSLLRQLTQDKALFGVEFAEPEAGQRCEAFTPFRDRQDRLQQRKKVFLKKAALHQERDQSYSSNSLNIGRSKRLAVGVDCERITSDRALYRQTSRRRHPWEKRGRDL